MQTLSCSKNYVWRLYGSVLIFVQNVLYKHRALGKEETAATR